MRILRIANRMIVIGHDLILIPLAWFGAYWLRFNLDIIPAEHILQACDLFHYVITTQGISYFFIGSYRSMWGFASIYDVFKIIKTVLLGGLLLFLTLYLTSRTQGLPRSIIPLYMLSLIASLSGSRLLVRWIRDYLTKQQTPNERVLIIGAGTAAEGLVRDMIRTNTYRPIALVDDKSNKQGQEIHGIRVQGAIRDIPQVIAKYHIESIIVAIPSATSSNIRRIMKICEASNLPIHTLPALKQIVAGQVSVDLLRKVSLEDLLGRDPVILDWTSIQNSINNKSILVTGAGGSIGSELCRQICNLHPKELILLDSSEFNLFTLEQELNTRTLDFKLHKCLIDIRDKVAIKQLFIKQKPEIVFHAAAYKHVPMLQTQIRAAISNNILGTQIVAMNALSNSVEKFILVSTDKAVNPCNIMGATKRAAEIVCKSFNTQSQVTHFITVRFGNVLGSAGSVVPIFKQQIDQGGPVTVTDAKITRYFMTIPEATQLIMQAMTIGKGGEIFILDMGEPIKISTLAEHMIKLAGKRPGIDIDIKYTGLRSGEKLYEELFYDKEDLNSTNHPKILSTYPKQVNISIIYEILKKMSVACHEHKINDLNKLLRILVPEMV